MAYNTRRIKKDLDEKPIPQVYNPVADEYEPLQGSAAGGNRVQLYDGDGNPVGVATDAKLEAARVLLASLDDKDYATQTTLAAVLAKLADPSTAAKQDAAKAVLDAISTAVAARATEATLGLIKTALTDGSQKVQLSGSKVRIASAPATGVKTVTGTAAEVFAGMSRKPGRSRLEIANRHPALAIRVGPAGVTDTTGRSVGPLATLALDMDPMSDVPIYAVSEAGALTVEVFEA